MREVNKNGFVCICNFVNYWSDIMSQLELGKPEERRRPHKQVNGIFWIILINLGIYAADHVFQVAIRSSFRSSFCVYYGVCCPVALRAKSR